MVREKIFGVPKAGIPGISIIPIITLPLVKKQWYCTQGICHSIKSLDGVTKIEVFREMEGRFIDEFDYIELFHLGF
ncbi:MAG: hypothetical protein Q7J31_06285 [Syntrophales bacterium]|nr:hypothetical protein [Syntrophales bacterium]